MIVPKREFIQHTSHYLKIANHEEVIITHQGKPCLHVGPIRKKQTARDLRGKIKIVILENDINTPILPELDL